METNNSSEKKQQYINKGANKTTDNLNMKKGKGTGMSSEAGSSQTEESWQGAGGSNASEAQRKNMDSENDDKDLKGSLNMSNSGTSKKWNNSNSD